MSAPSHLAGCILTPEGWVRGRIAFVDTVVAIEGFPDAPASREECIVLPGFVDLHVHGGGGRDVMDGRGAVDTIATVHAQHGTTSLLATTMTAPRDDLNSALKDVARAMSDRQPGQARVAGVPQFNEIDALDDPARVDVETGNDALGEHVVRQPR